MQSSSRSSPMPLKMFRSSNSLKKLEENISKNINKYREGDFTDFLDGEHYQILDKNFSEGVLAALKNANGPEHDLDNSLLLWNKLKISPRIARDPRFWVVLTHGCCLRYVRTRWPFSGDEIEDIKVIKKHFLTEGARGIDRDNAVSRLWMSSYVASKPSLDMELALKVLLYKTDFRENLIGRPSVMQSLNTLDAVMATAKRILIDDENESFFSRKDGKGPYRRWLEELNLEGGTTLLDAMNKKDLQALVDRLADEANK